MKIKTISIILLTFLIGLLIPNAIFAAFENVDEVEDFGTKYQLFDDGTAKAISIKADTVNGATEIGPYVTYNEEEYKLTSISATALDGITEKQDLHIWAEIAPTLDNKDYDTFFANINNIYICSGAQGYSEGAGYPMEKVKVYKINTQPQDIIVTAGEIKDTDKLVTIAEIMVGPGSIGYSWYQCDQNGQITDQNIVEHSYELSVKDLSYNHETGTAKDYYFICAVGFPGEPITYSRVAKVTINPGAYKVTFHLVYPTLENVNPVISSVNSERKLEKTDVPTLAQIEKYKAGQEFMGWTTDGEEIVNPLTTIFDKNTELYPLWRTKIKLDTNGGKFQDGTTTFELFMTNFGISSVDLSEPIRDGYEIYDITDSKSGGKSIIDYMDEGGVIEEKTFYVQWLNLATGEVDKPVEDKEKNDETDSKNNPPTGDNIVFLVGIVVISIAGILSTTKFRKNAKK